MRSASDWLDELNDLPPGIDMLAFLERIQRDALWSLIEMCEKHESMFPDEVAPAYFRDKILELTRKLLPQEPAP